MNLLSKFLGLFRGAPKDQIPHVGIVGKSTVGKTALNDLEISSGGFGRPIYRKPTRCELFGRHKGRNSRIHKSYV